MPKSKRSKQRVQGSVSLESNDSSNARVLLKLGDQDKVEQKTNGQSDAGGDRALSRKSLPISQNV